MALADELFNTAQSLQTEVQRKQMAGDPASLADASLLSQAVALFLLASTQENAHQASASLLADANTAAQISTITLTVNAQSARLAAQIGRASTVISIGTNILTIIAGAANPLAVLPTLVTVVGQLSS